MTEEKVDSGIAWEVVEEKPTSEQKVEGAVEVEAEGSEEKPEAKPDKRFERRIRQLVRRAKTAEEAVHAAHARATQFEEELGQLRETVTNMQKGAVGSTREQLQREYVGARQRLAAAKEAGNTAEEIAATEAMMHTSAKWNSVQAPQIEPKKEAAPRQVETQERRDAGLHPKVKEWIDSRDWWETDDVARAAAIAIAGRLERDGELTADDPEYYDTVDRELTRRFPELYEGTEKKEKPRPVVGGGSRTSGASDTRSKVRLTPGQVKTAELLGLTTEQYAAEVKKINDATDKSGRMGPVNITVPGR